MGFQEGAWFAGLNKAACSPSFANWAPLANGFSPEPSNSTIMTKMRGLDWQVRHFEVCKMPITVMKLKLTGWIVKVPGA